MEAILFKLLEAYVESPQGQQEILALLSKLVQFIGAKVDAAHAAATVAKS